MANYNLVIDSKFQPFSLERYIAPYQRYGENYREIEDAYSDLETLSGDVGSKIKDEGEEIAQSQYNTYMKDLKAQADAISTYGLTQDSRRAMKNLKSRYSTEIKTISDAYNTRAKQIEEERQNELKGVVYNTKASETSLDEYLKNPTLQHEGVDTNASMKRIAMGATTIGKKLSDHIKEGKQLDKFTKQMMYKYGVDASNVDSVIASINDVLRGGSNELGNGILNDIIKNEMVATGVDNWNTASQLKWFNAVSPALYGAVGEEKPFTFTDQAKVMATEHSYKETERKNALQEKIDASRREVINIDNVPAADRRLDLTSGLWVDKKGRLLVDSNNKPIGTSLGKDAKEEKEKEEKEEQKYETDLEKNQDAFMGVSWKAYNKDSKVSLEAIKEYGSKDDKSGISLDDAHIIALNSLNNVTLSSIENKVKKANLNLENVVLIEDEDLFPLNNNHYLVLPKSKVPDFMPIKDSYYTWGDIKAGMAGDTPKYKGFNSITGQIDVVVNKPAKPENNQKPAKNDSIQKDSVSNTSNKKGLIKK